MLQSNKIQLSATLKDLVVDQLDIGLEVEFRGSSGTFISDPALRALPFTINKGFPTMLSNAELSIYFQSNGLSEAVVANGGFLPEGEWEICVTAFELLNGEQVSRQTCYYMFLEELDPPSIIFPEDSILPSYPQNIQLGWQPLHIGAFPVRYTMNIWETFDGFSDNQVVESTPPYISKSLKQQTIDWLTIADPRMTVGQTYIMQVQIEDDINGMMGPQVYAFENNGFSKIHRFKYGMYIEGEECEKPSAPEYLVDDSLRYFLYWDEGEPPEYNYTGNGASSSIGDGGFNSINNESSGYTSSGYDGLGIAGGSNASSTVNNSTTSSIFTYYKMHYRIEGTEEWSTTETTESWAEFTGFTRGRTYEVYVTKVCSAEERASDIITIIFPTLPPARIYECGLPLLPIDLENEEPLADLYVDDTIIAADFRVVIREVSGGNGRYSGEGAFKTGLFGAAVEVEFTDIFVNSEYRMVDGFVQTTWDPEGSFMFNLDSLFASFSNTSEPAFPKIEVTQIDTIIVQGTSIVVQPGNITHEMPVYIVSPDRSYLAIAGMVLLQGDKPNPSSISEDYQVYFETQNRYLYGFDGVDANYDNIYKKFDGKSIPHKAVAYQGRDKLDAKISVAATSWTASDWDSVKVVTADGFELKYDRKSGNSKVVEIWVPGLDKDQNIYVMYKEECMGVFSTQVFEFTNLKVNLIPVNGAGIAVEVDTIQARLNKILGQGVFGVEVNFRKDENIESEFTELPADKYALNANGLEMRSIIKSHEDQYTQDRNEMYIFLHGDLKGNVTGYMPHGYNAGFVEMNSDNATLVQTIAHELGHGAFTLEHYFKETDEGEGTTDNLLDYNGGTALNYFQWKRMHSRKMAKGWFQSGEEQMQIGEGKIACLTVGEVSKMNLGTVFYDGNLKAFNIPATAIPRSFYRTDNEAELQGVIHSFIDQNQIWSLHYIAGTTTFAGYAPVANPDDQKFSERKYKYDNIETVGEKVIIDHVAKTAVVNAGTTSSAPFLDISCDCPAGGGTGVGASQIFNLSKTDLEDLEFMKELMGGKRTILDVVTGQWYRDTKAMLFITDGSTSDDSIKWVEAYEADSDVVKIWVHQKDAEWNLRNQVGRFDELDDLITNSGGASLSTQLKGSLKELCVLTYELSDLLSKGIKKAKIPSYVWNPEDPSYDEVYLNLYKTITYPIAKVKDKVSALQGLGYNFNENELATFCGIWNGIVEFAVSIPEMAKLITGTASGEIDLKKAWASMANYKDAQDTTKTGRTAFAVKMLGDIFPLDNQPLASHNLTELIVAVGIGIYAGTATVSASNRFSTIIKILKILDKVESFAFTAIGKLGGGTIKLIGKAGDNFVAEVKNAIMVTESMIDGSWKRMDFAIDGNSTLVLRATFPDGNNAPAVYKLDQQIGETVTTSTVRTARIISSEVYEKFLQLGITKVQVDQLLAKLDGDLNLLENTFEILEQNKSIVGFPDLIIDLLDPKGLELLKKIGKGDVENGGRVLESWEFVKSAMGVGSTSNKIVSVDILESVSKHLNDVELLNIIGNGNSQIGRNAFGELISKYVGKCKCMYFW